MERAGRYDFCRCLLAVQNLLGQAAMRIMVFVIACIREGIDRVGRAQSDERCCLCVR